MIEDELKDKNARCKIRYIDDTCPFSARRHSAVGLEALPLLGAIEVSPYPPVTRLAVAFLEIFI